MIGLPTKAAIKRCGARTAYLIAHTEGGKRVTAVWRREERDVGAFRSHSLASVACHRSGLSSCHADTAAVGGPRRPLISATMPAKPCRGRAASANWKTA